MGWVDGPLPPASELPPEVVPSDGPSPAPLLREQLRSGYGVAVGLLTSSVGGQVGLPLGLFPPQGVRAVRDGLWAEPPARRHGAACSQFVVAMHSRPRWPLPWPADTRHKPLPVRGGAWSGCVTCMDSHPVGPPVSGSLPVHHGLGVRPRGPHVGASLLSTPGGAPMQGTQLDHAFTC